jgi:peptide deformylase
MPLLRIEYLGSPVLRERATEVVEIDERIRLLIDDMFRTMYGEEGIGLAAPQVGVSKRVIVVDLRDEGTTPLALVNPRIVESSTQRAKAEEGCLSIPGVAAPVERPVSVVVEGLDRDGYPVRIEADGLLARCLQHEVDHIDGILFIDRVSPLQRDMLLKRYRRRMEAAPRADR